MRVAIPVFNGRVAPRFDFAAQLLVVTIEDEKVKGKEEISLLHLSPLKRINRLDELGVSVLICGGIGSFFERLLTGHGIKVIQMVTGEIKDVIYFFINGNMDSMMLPSVKR